MSEQQGSLLGQVRSRPLSILNGRDPEALDSLFALHAPSATEILDVTYNRGVMWKGCEWQPSVTSDLDPTVDAQHHHDFRDLPAEWSARFDVIVFDPPHLPAAIASARSSGIERRQYGLTDEGDYRQGDNITPSFSPFVKEARRVLRPDGIVFAKIADFVHNHRYQWQHVDLVLAARAEGMTPCDLLIKADPAASNLKSSKWRNVHHFRRAHCYWLVLRNSSKCEAA